MHRHCTQRVLQDKTTLGRKEPGALEPPGFPDLSTLCTAARAPLCSPLCRLEAMALQAACATKPTRVRRARQPPCHPIFPRTDPGLPTQREASSPTRLGKVDGAGLSICGVRGHYSQELSYLLSRRIGDGA